MLELGAARRIVELSLVEEVHRPGCIAQVCGKQGIGGHQWLDLHLNQLVLHSEYLRVPLDVVPIGHVRICMKLSNQLVILVCLIFLDYLFLIQLIGKNIDPCGGPHAGLVVRGGFCSIAI